METPPPPDLPALRQQAIQAIKNALQGENFNLTNSNWESQIQTANSPEAIRQIEGAVLADIDNKRQEQQKVQKLDGLLRQGQATNDPTQLATIFKQIQNLSNTDAYRNKKTEIDALEKKLQELNPQKYQETVQESVQEQLDDKGIKEKDLSSENQEKWQQLKNKDGQLTPEKIKEFKDEIIQEANQKAAENELEELLAKHQEAKTPNQKNLIKNEILKFISENEYQKKAYEKNKKKVNEILGLATEQKNTSSPNSFPWQIVIPISLAGILVVGVIIILRKRKMRSKKIN